jgi:hypothetical protein
MDQASWTISLTTWIVSMRTSSSLWRCKKTAIFYSLVLTSTVNLMARGATQSARPSIAWAECCRGKLSLWAYRRRRFTFAFGLWRTTCDSRLQVYSVPCECGKVYIGQTGRSIETRVEEHHHYIRLENTAIESNSSSPVSSPPSPDTYRMIREAIEIDLNPNKMDKNDGLRLRQSRKPVIHCLKESRKPATQTQCLSRPEC